MMSAFCLGCVTISFVALIVAPLTPLSLVVQFAVAFYWGWNMAGLVIKDDAEQIRRRLNGD